MSIILGGCSNLTKESVIARQYPTKPINIIVPFAAGGGMDLLARALEKSSHKHLGQPLVVVNVTGGAGTIGMNEIAGAKPDGYTIGVAGTSAILQPLYGETRYHYATALEPLVQVVSLPMVVAIQADKPWNSVNDLVNYAKEHPGEIKFGHAGLGSTSHIAGEMLGKEAGINVVQVPFKGDMESLTALLGGHVQFIFGNPAVIKEHVKSGKVKILGVAEETRLTIPDFENIPTFKEQGINLAFNFWIGIVAPKELPVSEKERLLAGLKEMINDSEFKKSMADIGMEIKYSGSEEFGDRWLKDNIKLTKIIKETGIADIIKAQKK
ncbi:Bug family tripartite tricarboxylate transporter substrate binding protein [Sporomusa rhizae]|uniref:Bug family tripartite tricarboxylate transporter substrate binding protein n=1 Tax=Sporomusa rhizae TaxID=357999 RepID=UPI00352B8FB4